MTLNEYVYERGCRWAIGVSLLLMLSCSGKQSEPGIQEFDAGSAALPDEDAGKEPIAETPLKSPLRALTPLEYNNSIRDLLDMPASSDEWPKPPKAATEITPEEGEVSGLFGGAPVAKAPWPWSFPKEPGIEHFQGIADGQEPSPYSVEQLQKASLHFAGYALLSPSFFACEKWNEAESNTQKQCAEQSIKTFAQKAWRRPLTDDESERLQGFWESNWESSTPEQAVILTVAGILQSPAFLFKLEPLEDKSDEVVNVPLSSWQIATRLSYFLWDSTPDHELLAAAENNTLSTREEIETQARRMLKDPKARRAVVEFHHQWLGTDRVRGISPSRRVYGPTFGISPAPPLDTTGDGVWPALLGPIRHSMEAETHLFIERTLFDGAGTLKALLTDNHGYMSAQTAPIYGDNALILPGPTVSWEYGIVVFSQGSKGTPLELYPTEFPPSERAGVLTLPSVLALGAYTVHPAPILRGKMILERLACQQLGAPIPGAEASAPPDSETATASNRKRTEDATSPAECSGCHELLNPPGFAFENYDSMGKWRDTDNGNKVDASGTLTLQNGEAFTFKDGIEFTNQLAESQAVKDCYALRWSRYATGVQLQMTDPEVSPVLEHFRSNNNVMDLLVAIATSKMFRFRSAGGQK